MVGLRFIYNLLKRHPSCKVLIHREGDAVTSYTDDPFVETEENPAKCRALDSSLWETQALLHHYHADVARLPQVNANIRRARVDHTAAVLRCTD